MTKNFVKIAVKNIGTDPSYQRDIDDARVDAMAREFDPSRIGVPVLSLRKDGSHVVLDGQHRIEAMRRCNREDEKILCEVYNGLSLVDEAQLFLKLNNGRKPVSAFNKYKAQMTAREPATVEMTRIVTSLGLRIGIAPGKNTICAIRSIESVHKRACNLELTLSILKQWGRGDASVFDGDLIKDVSRFMVDHGEEIDIDKFTTNLSKNDPSHVLRRIRAMFDVLNRNRRLAANSVFRDIYNHRLPKKERLTSVGAAIAN